MELEGLFFNTTDYKIKSKKLGKGSYGTVYLAKNLKDGQLYAIKIFHSEEEFDGDKQTLFLQESMILRSLHHPCIVKFYGISFKSISNKSTFEPTILTEYLPSGSLKDVIEKENLSLSDDKWNPTKKYIIIIGLCDALRYLHEQGIVHRDVKPENVLLDANYYPRLCDFGLSKSFSKSLTKSMNLTISGQIGTPLYMAPEILRGEKFYDASIDVYAFAMIVYEIVTGKTPFSDTDESSIQLIMKIVNGSRPKFPEFVTKKMQDLLSKCWSDDPKERLSFGEIFDLLSNDMSYFNEDVDKDEITNFIEALSASKKENSLNKKCQEIRFVNITAKENKRTKQTSIDFSFLEKLVPPDSKYSIKVTTFYENEILQEITKDGDFLINNCDIVALGGVDAFFNEINNIDNVVFDKLKEYNDKGGFVLLLHDTVTKKTKYFTDQLGITGHYYVRFGKNINVKFVDESEKFDIISTPFKFTSKTIQVADNHSNILVKSNSKCPILCFQGISFFYYYFEDLTKRIAFCAIGHSNDIKEDEQKLFYNIICHEYKNNQVLNNTK